jgi:Ca2+:H+ antiporter
MAERGQGDTQGPETEDEREAKSIKVGREEEPQKPAPKMSITGGTGQEGLFKTRLPLSRIEKGALILLLGAPVAVFGEVLGASSIVIFIGAAAAIMPLALLMGRATEELAIRSGPGLSAFLLATFGNATELIIAVVAVNKGLIDLARASLVGSIIINVLLVMGLSFMTGGIKFPVMNYSRITASATLSMLTVSVVAVMLPSLYYYSEYGFDHIGPFPEDITTMSIFVAAVLLAVYVSYMIFSMRTHKKYFDGHSDAPIERTRRPEPHLATWPASTAVLMLVVTMVSVVGIAELLIGEIEHIMENAGLSDFFMGVIVIALVGNAAEHSSAILMAWRGRIELSFQIAMGSSVQIALLVIPLLVFISMAIGNVMAMVFTPLGLIAMIATLAIAMVIALDGQATWFEGLMLVAIFILIGGIAALV